MSDYSDDEIGVTYPSSTEEPTVTIPRAKYDALMAGVNALKKSQHLIVDLAKELSDQDIRDQIEENAVALAALRAAGIQTEEQ
jgi:hypothetical protein